MKRRTRKKPVSPNLLRLFLALWIVASLGYWIAGIVDLWDTRIHWDQLVNIPFRYDSDSRRIENNSLQPEARAIGLAAGDRLDKLNGAPYTGLAQWDATISESHPGDILEVDVTRPDGSEADRTLTLVRRPYSYGRLSPTWAFWQGFLLIGLLTLVCLLIGYWVVLTRPADRNAWLLLVLLTFPSVVFINAGLASGVSLFLRNFWYETQQLAGSPALLIFGIYFPERSRIDARAPWIKWILFGVFGVALCALYPSLYMENYGGGDGPILNRASDIASTVINTFNLLCVILYLVLTLDKLRSASTEDARRRLRVLTTGMSIGMGALLLVFVLLPDLPPPWRITGNSTAGYWIRSAGALFFMIAPLTLAYVVVVQRALDVRVLLRIGSRYALARATLWVLQIALLAVIGIRLFLPMFERRVPQPSDVWAALVFLVLIIALRFGVGKRLEQWLDRRFFREAYNAEVMLNELSDEVRRFTETKPLLETVARTVCDTLHIRQIAMLLRHGDAFHLEQALGFSADSTLALPAQASSIRYLSNSNEPARLYRDDPDAWYLMAGTAERRALDLLNAELLVPLPGRNRLMGVMALGPKRSEAAWSRTDLQVLQTVARQTGLALEVSELAHSLATEAAQRERVNREMEIAREVQERLFPQEMPDIVDASLAGACRAALGVGGDYYDVFSLEDGRLGLAIGDVSGKGISAALLMASLRASLRGVSLNSPRNFADLMHKINVLVYEASASNRYATFFFAAYDPKTRRLECVNAGHNPPVLLRNGEVIRLEAGGPVVGLLPLAPYLEQALTLEPGDLLLLYTDGISEAMTHDDEEWGEDRMIEAATKVRAKDAAEVLRALFAACDKFTAGAPQHDDMTMLILNLDSTAPSANTLHPTL
jgi:sigma-B regulation protein RsbU (phosphoserine phosphatase)